MENKDFFNFIDQHRNEDPVKLLLRYGKINNPIDYKFAILQILCRKKYNKKFNLFLINEYFLFPSQIAAEQATHSNIADFHASLNGGAKEMLDMTGGLGIDSLSFATRGINVTVCETDQFKSEILKHNFKSFDIENFEVINKDSTQYLKETTKRFDLIFIDPSRRDAENKRVFKLEECQPNILEFQNHIFDKARRVLIKLSPLMDISEIIRNIRDIAAINIISLKGEVKEVLVECVYNDDLNSNKIEFSAIDLGFDKNEIISEFRYSIEADEKFKILAQLNSTAENYLKNYEDITNYRYLYDPNAAIMKLKPWDFLQKKFQSLLKISPSTHLFLSNKLYTDFPGRILKIKDIMTKKDLKNLKGSQVNIVCKNFPKTPEQIRKDLKLKEGLGEFLYAFSCQNKMLNILASLTEDEEPQNLNPADKTI